MTTSATRFYDVAEPGTLHANTDVAVEPQFLPRLTQLAADLGDPVDDQVFFTVTIVPEPDNPRSELGRALSVRWRDRIIGYLSSEDADRFQQFRRIVASGWTPASRGRLFVASRVTSDRRDYFLSVSLRAPETVIPVNDPPDDPWVLLPHGKTVQVTGESVHLDVLLDRVPHGGVGQILVSLHEIDGDAEGGDAAPVVEVRLDGRRIGQLPGDASAAFLPAVRHFDSQGQLTVARARLKGSPLSAEVTLQAATASDLSEEDLATDVRPLPRLVPFLEDARMYPVPDAFQGDPSGAGSGETSGATQGPAPKNPYKRRPPAARPASPRMTRTTQTTVTRRMPPGPGMPVHPGPPVRGGRVAPVGPGGPVVHGTMYGAMPAPMGPGMGPGMARPAGGPAAGTVASTVLLSFGIAVGALLVLGGLGLLAESFLGALGGIVVGMSIIVPCAWPMVCRRRDRKALEAWEEDQATSRELASHLTEEDALIAKGLAPTPRPAPVPRKWKKVGTAAGVAAVIGVGMLGVSGVGDDPADGSGTGGVGDQPGVSRQE